ncbi:hypothetical protein DSM106972_044510 [Dulcicalothrix desertica PCC 7102]|uniref:Uncharacterized protein n=1 Tax=Dulcicalothrix desertica PCC 7102 TaxID=232991 RepID=A0A3S1IXQ2_9CYAN|nr:hypothetical protein [Dulcicalothrix desertica]RUT04223.1 hypothetical protein DSM106972_044510 [Dulcicalothrix desertica PCC 7102]TWH51473.1 hypothetical protein CAL7102_05895 [Dulcicalothrix desertica PCC 7102]
MMNCRFVLVITSLVLLNTGVPNYSNLPVLAHNKNILKKQNSITVAQRCGNTEAVKPSKTSKTVRFPKFGIKVKIPSNYKTFPRKDGSISILDPGSYEAVRCQAPHGLYSFNIKLLPNSKNLSLQAFAKSAYEGQLKRVYDYNQNNIRALLIDSESGYSAYGIFKVRGVKGIVEMNASCDCDVSRTNIIDYLKVTELIR